MSPLPVWLVYATPAVALFAAVVAIASFFVALATYRRAGPRTRLTFEGGYIVDERISEAPRDVPGIAIEITNRGLASIEINDFLLRPPTLIAAIRRGLYLLFEEGDDVERVSGDALPVTIPPNSIRRWAYIVHHVGGDEYLVENTDEIHKRIQRSMLEAQLGNGRILKQRILAYGDLIKLGVLESELESEPKNSGAASGIAQRIRKRLKLKFAGKSPD